MYTLIVGAGHYPEVVTVQREWVKVETCEDQSKAIYFDTKEEAEKFKVSCGIWGSVADVIELPHD